MPLISYLRLQFITSNVTPCLRYTKHKTHMINILMPCIQHELIVEYRQV